tara:strand:- start:11257 stop:15948 length:4692 start_codon:yes stop_codon:yes gene_type:complete
MRTRLVLLGLVLTLTCFNAFSKIVQIEQDQTATDFLRQTKSPFYVGDQTPTLYVTAGIDRRVFLVIKNDSGSVVFTYDYPEVQFTDTFTIDSVQYQGVLIETSLLDPGRYDMSLKIYDDADLISSFDYELNVDGVPPSISGDFYWDTSYRYYYDEHTDGKLIIGTSQVKTGGFPSHSQGGSPVGAVTFSSQYIDGPLAGEFHAQSLEASIIDGAVVIGNGSKGSVSNTYIPNNTEAEMELTFTVTSASGLSASKSTRVYVDTLRSTVTPMPYGVFTGDPVELDGNPAFAGFVPYVPGMPLDTNPVRMIYRAPKEAFVGGGGRADIYGAWVKTQSQSTRGENGIVYKDSDYLYYDVTATTSGSELDPMVVYTKDITSWRNKLFLHDFNLDADAKPPVITNLDMYVEGLDTWYYSNTSVNSTVYITKEDTGYEEDEITKIRVTVEPRAYEQKFNYSFSVYGSNVSDYCLVSPNESQCTIETNLPYPGHDIQVYHNRHRVVGVDNGMTSNEAVSNWRYDGYPAQIDFDSINITPESERFSVLVTKDYASRVWSQSTIREVDAFAVKLPVAGNMETDIPDPSKRQYLDLFTESYEVVNDVIQRRSYFEYDSLTEGEYALYLYVEDGFNSTFNHTNDYFIQTLSIGDKTPPQINLNVADGDIVFGLTGIIVELIDSSDAWVDEILLTGGPESVNMSLPLSDRGEGEFRPEHVYIEPSDSQPYTLVVKAEDEFQNATQTTVNFYYVPPTITLPDVELAAIANAVRSLDGQAHNVLLTSEVRDYANTPAVGNHEIYFTLLPSATESFVVNGETVVPGQTISFSRNLTDSNGKIRLVVFPENSGVLTSADYQITVPEVRIQVCPDTFTQEPPDRCVYVDIVPATPTCSDDYTLSDDSSACLRVLSYVPEVDCNDGYELNLNTMVCSGFIEKEPVLTCPSSYGLIPGDMCRKHETVPASPCPGGFYENEGACTDGNTFQEFGHYCAGLDVSLGSACDENGICYSYEADWNACEKVTLVDPTLNCHEGSIVDGNCQVLDTYSLNGSCDSGYSIVDGQCEKLDIVEPTYICQPGSNPSEDGSVCETVYYEPFSGCPNGHDFINDRCYLVSAPQETCPTGYDLGSTCEMQNIGIPVDSCLPGHDLVNGYCYPLSEPVLTCDSGTLEGGNCVTSTSLPPQSCQTGYEMVNGECFEVVAKEASCSGESVLIDGVCITTGATYEPMSCAEGYKPVLTVPEPSPIFDSFTPPEEQLPGDIEPTITCHELTLFPGLAACPVEYTYNNGACYLNDEQYFDPDLDNIIYLDQSDYQQVCLSSNLYFDRLEDDVIRCYEPTPSSIGFNCESNDVLNDDGLCEIVTESTPAYSCPPSHSSLNATECISDSSTNSAGICAAGLTLNVDNGMCLQEGSQPADVTCPGSSTLTTSQLCRSDSADLAAGICDVGVLQSDGTCTETLVTDITYSCLTGQTLTVDNSCLADSPSPSVGICDPDFTVEEANCSETIVTPLQAECPNDFDHNNGQCHRLQTAPLDIGCNSDETEANGLCLRSLEGDVFMNCMAPYSLYGVDQCKHSIDILQL